MLGCIFQVDFDSIRFLRARWWLCFGTRYFRPFEIEDPKRSSMMMMMMMMMMMNKIATSCQSERGKRSWLISPGPIDVKKNIAAEPQSTKKGMRGGWELKTPCPKRKAISAFWPLYGTEIQLFKPFANFNSKVSFSNHHIGWFTTSSLPSLLAHITIRWIRS